MPAFLAWITDLEAFLSPSELTLPDTPLYKEETAIWATQKDLKPKVLLRPLTVEQLSQTLAYLNQSDLDFGVRSGGVGSGSAKDVLISMTAFQGFEFDAEAETVTIGTGQIWGEVDRKLEKHAPGYAALSARCSFVGVGGAVVSGGISWASSEFGMTSDPHNFLDAQVVTVEGRILWASEEPDLLWALRGGGGGFGVVTAVKLKVHKYTNLVYSGSIVIPNEALPELAQAATQFAQRTQDPKMAMHIFCLDLAHAALSGQDPSPGIMVVVYDANGEAHGRSDEGFGWALKIKGVVDNTRIMTSTEANQQQDNLRVAMGMTNSYMSAATIPSLSEDLIFRAWKWFNDLLEKDPRQSTGAFVLLEIMQRPAFSSASSPEATAWPRTQNRHILQLGTGTFPGSSDSDALSLKALAKAPYEINPGHTPADYLPSFIESFNDVEAIFGGNFEKLKEVKRRYDPRGRLGGFFA
ncbi:hypothetical protein H2200_013327 [Cladophialophora chaetospira]|uniref:FAD-binding PCMH-type domain-containing protein n=1 Tax=Cladophialophora chaetospira TaxID=386627 RepID=A0AA38WW38_9EURO|nr:hypothetical protein H2200_013327 [Cladophialophora chaetospira]